MNEVEVDSNSERIYRVFFCDPYSSSQKGACERNHEFIRYILPKGRSLDCLTQKDVDLMFSHINSTPRKSLGFHSPYFVFSNMFGKDFLNRLNIHLIDKEDVLLKPTHSHKH
jgi:transposase and inactivated derivatives, IS30 family